MPAKHIITSRKSSPVKNEVSYRSSQRATVAEYKSPYDQARDYVKHFTCWNKPGEIPSIGSDEIDSYEKPFSVQMPFDDWVKLSNDLQLSETEQRLESLENLTYSAYNLRYPKYGYNASISTLIIKCMPSPVHESAIDIINSGFIVAREGLPPESDFGISTGEEFLGFEGQYAGSLKVPDLAVEFTDAALGSRPKFIVEVGLSETYDDLLQDAKLWLEGTDYVSIVVLVKFVETPKYESLNLRTKDLVDRNFLKAPDLNELHFEMRGEYGPVQYKGIQWAGVISEAFLEVWKRNPITRLAVRDGGRTVRFS